MKRNVPHKAEAIAQLKRAIAALEQNATFDADLLLVGKSIDSAKWLLAAEHETCPAVCDFIQPHPDDAPGFVEFPAGEFPL